MPKRGQQQLNSKTWKCACGFQASCVGDERSCEKKIALVKRLHKKKCEKVSKTTETVNTTLVVNRNNPHFAGNGGNLTHHNTNFFAES